MKLATTLCLIAANSFFIHISELEAQNRGHGTTLVQETTGIIAPQIIDLGSMPVGLDVFQAITVTNELDSAVALQDEGGFSFSSDAYTFLVPDSGCPAKTYLDAKESRQLL